MTGLVIGMAVLMSVGGAPQHSGGVTASTVSGSSVERLAEPSVGLRLPSDLMDEQPQLLWRAERPRKAQTTSARQSSTVAKVIGLAVGGLGGFYAGGMIGFYVAQDRNANDDGVSGLRGVVIGAPVGAAVGALLGYQIAK
jgi:hypothetical protein